MSTANRHSIEMPDPGQSLCSLPFFLGCFRMAFPDLTDLAERIRFSQTALAEERRNGGGAGLSWFDLPTAQASYSYRLNI